MNKKFRILLSLIVINIIITQIGLANIKNIFSQYDLLLEKEKTPLKNTHEELFYLDGQIWHRSIGENEFFLTPHTYDIISYNERITKKDDKENGIIKSKFHIVDVEITSISKSLLSNMGIQVPDYIGNKLYVYLPQIDIDILLDNNINHSILDTYGKTVTEIIPDNQNRTTIWNEDFEGSFPGSDYEVNDSNPDNDEDYWDDLTCEYHSGSMSLWCADIGDQSNCQNYNDNMFANFWKPNGIYVEGYTDVQFSFWKKYDTEENYDKLKRFYWNGTEWILSYEYTGNSGGWTETIIGLSNFQTFYFYFIFYSDGSIHNYEGAYLDDMLITGNLATLDCISDVEYIQINGKTVNAGGSINVQLSSLSETFQVKLRGENDGSDTSPAGFNNLTMSFPQYTLNSDKDRITISGRTSSDLKVTKYFGSETYGCDADANYVMVESTDNNGWGTDESNNLYLDVQPKEWGSFEIYYRMGLATDESWDIFNYDPSGGCSPSDPNADCLGYASYKVTVNVIQSSPDIHVEPSLLTFDIPSGNGETQLENFNNNKVIIIFRESLNSYNLLIIIIYIDDSVDLI